MGGTAHPCLPLPSPHACEMVALRMIPAFLTGAVAILGPNLWWLVSGAVLVAIMAFPMPGRGPNASTRDVWRGFKYEARRTILARAGDRCEGAAFAAWGRCSSPAVEVDHVFPWSRGGPTVVSNGQALCVAHNRSKGAMHPPWWYVLGLERRRHGYFPVGVDVRVFAVMKAEDTTARNTRATQRQRARTTR